MFIQVDDLKERLIEIDENLARVGLPVIDEGEQHEERQQIAEALGLATRKGQPKKSDTVSDLPKAYTDQAATATKESPRLFL